VAILPFGLAVRFALLASPPIALTVIPVLACFFVRRVAPRVDASGELPETAWQRLCTPTLRFVLLTRRNGRRSPSRSRCSSSRSRWCRRC
jgi:Cu/Ag efflux pump CusA